MVSPQKKISGLTDAEAKTRNGPRNDIFLNLNEVRVGIRHSPGRNLIAEWYKRTIFCAPAPAQDSVVSNRTKNPIAVACLSIILVGAGVAAMFEERREQEQEQRDREFALKLLHATDLTALYEQINVTSFGGQLRPDVPVSWADLRSNPDCGKCGAMTDYDSGRPAIRFDNERVRTEKGLRRLMQHEMCHVAVIDAATKLRQESHGPLWQECMKRFE